MAVERKKTKEISIGNKTIGGGRPILIQSMANTDSRDVNATVAQIRGLERAGCEIVRIACPNEQSALAAADIKKQITIPLVADIHFDYKLALLCLRGGVDKLRINPGNIGAKWKIKEVAESAKARGVPIRIGVNAGSLEKDLYDKMGVTAGAVVESCMRHVEILEQFGFYDIVLSLKSSSVPLTIESYDAISRVSDYPLHVGVTESGTQTSGSIKSAVGIGAILSRGIGDTVRVSLTASPAEEIKCAKEILKSLGLRKFGVEVISCPTCGRTEIDIIKIANDVEAACASINKNITVAVMGCVVNGVGEGKEADIGIAGGNGSGILFKKGEIIAKLKEEELFPRLMREIENYNGNLVENDRQKKEC